MSKFFKTAIIFAACFLSLANLVSAKSLIEAEIKTKLEKVDGAVFPIGEPNTNYEKYFTGKSYVAWFSNEVPMGNVTFVDGAHTFLAHSSQILSNFNCRIGARILSNLGRKSSRTFARTSRHNSRRRETLARSGSKLYVSTYCGYEKC